MNLMNEVQEISNEITGEDKAKAILDLAKQPENMVRFAVSDKISNKIKTDEKTTERIEKAADKLVESGVQIIENEAQAGENKSEKNKLDTYFEKHKEELKTAGIESATYQEDMERGVKWHRKWSNVHWILFGWWMTGIRTMFMKAKPFKLWLNIVGLIICIAITVGISFGIAYLIRLIVPLVH